MANQNQLKFYRNLGVNILQARMESGLELREDATKISKTQSYISKAENGDIKVDLYTLSL